MKLVRFLLVVFAVNLLPSPSEQLEIGFYKSSGDRIQLPECDYVHIDVTCRRQCCRNIILQQVPYFNSSLNQSFFYSGHLSKYLDSFKIDISEKNLNVTNGTLTETFSIERDLQTLKGRTLTFPDDCARNSKSFIIPYGCITAQQIWKIATLGVGGAAIFFVIATLSLVICVLHLKRTIRALRGKVTKMNSPMDMQNVRMTEPRQESDQFKETADDIYENPSNEPGWHLRMTEPRQKSDQYKETMDDIYENISNEPGWHVRITEPRRESDQYKETADDIYENPSYEPGWHSDCIYENASYTTRSNQSMEGNHLNTPSCNGWYEIPKSTSENSDIIYENISNVIPSNKPMYVNNLDLKY
ncbi:uncharacterized protein [Palaemon carinicauda]|uniref:uncharacterized protein n=1 Tax=Palaemon carinicauda TaxID=392227 RepID=UPI0035B616D6